MLLRTARRKGGAIFVWHTLAPAISREDHSSYCFVQSGGAPALRELTRDMEQNNEDALGSKRSAEIHSDEVQRDRVSSARAPGKRVVLRNIGY